MNNYYLEFMFLNVIKYLDFFGVVFNFDSYILLGVLERFVLFFLGMCDVYFV